MKCYSKQITKHKFLEIEAGEHEEWWSYFDFHVGWSRRVDHAGFRFEIDIVCFSFSFIIYDHRHWNFDQDDWCSEG